MSNYLSSLFDSVTFTNYFRLECIPVQNFHLNKYFRLGTDAEEIEEFDEYVRLEIKDSGEVEEVVGLEMPEAELDEVVGVEIEILPDTAKFEEVVGVEIQIEEDYDDLSDIFLL
jgi:hypothetical protein